MNKHTPIYLVDQTFSEDDAAIISEAVTERMVFADVTSVSLTEWTEGARNGLNPELRFTMFYPDYSGEQILKYNGDYFSIYRTYIGRNDKIDLYCERRSGTDDPSGRVNIVNQPASG